MRQQIVEVNGHQVPYSILEGNDFPHPGVICVKADTNDPADVERVLREAVLRQAWRLEAWVREEPLAQCFSLGYDRGRVGLYVFGTSLPQAQIDELARALGTFQAGLVDPSLWHGLQSVQVRATNELNPKNGQMKRGAEFPASQRFELYPATFDPGRYRDMMPCSWLTGAVLHEATHVCLEAKLRALWQAEPDQFGWILPPDGI